MSQKRRKGPRQKDMTADYLSDAVDTDRVERQQRFSARSASAEQNKILRTSLMRLAEQGDMPDVQTLPIGQVVQVFSLYCHIDYQGVFYLAVVRKTLSKISDTAVVVGDRVRFRILAEAQSGSGQPEAVIEQIEPRQTILTRADSFKAMVQHPIVANAQQMLIVVALAEPRPKWGLIDRMIIAAQSGNLVPIVCLNKVDLAHPSDADEILRDADAVLNHYATLGIAIIRTSVTSQRGFDILTQILAGKVTVLAGHSGVGKSSLINMLQPALNLRTAAISGYTGKGRHTTTSARYFPLAPPSVGAVIDTPGVKMFGLWDVSRDNLADYFPDIADDTAPEWRRDSYQRILDTLPES